jgi:hypothetical protein
MICSVRWLDTASHAVRLLAGWLTDGMMNGNIDRPAVRMTPTTARALAASVTSGMRAAAVANTPSAPTNPAIGAAIIQG